jgi:hypothetical protein
MNAAFFSLTEKQFTDILVITIVGYFTVLVAAFLCTGIAVILTPPENGRRFNLLVTVGHTFIAVWVMVPLEPVIAWLSLLAYGKPEPAVQLAVIVSGSIITIVSTISFFHNRG